MIKFLYALSFNSCNARVVRSVKGLEGGVVSVSVIIGLLLEADRVDDVA